MGTRERAQMIFDRLTDEELAGFAALFEHRITAEPPMSVFPKNRAELNAMLGGGGRRYPRGQSVHGGRSQRLFAGEIRHMTIIYTQKGS